MPPAGVPSALITTGRHRLLGARRDARDRRGDVGSRCDDRRHEEADHRVDAGIGDQRGQRRLVGRGRRRAEQVDRVGDARLGRDHLRGAPAPSRRRAAAAQPGGLARVGAENAETARVRQHRDTVAARQRLRREENGGVEQLFERAQPQHAGLPEERVDRRVGAGERGRVRAGGARAGATRSAPHRKDRLRARDPAGDAGELARVPERLQVEEDQIGRVVLLPVLEQVVRRDVGLVPDREEARQAEPARVGLLEQRETERAALRRERDAARREAAAREGRVQPDRASRRCRGSSGRRAGRRGRARARAARPAAPLRRRRSRRSPRR